MAGGRGPEDRRDPVPSLLRDCRARSRSAPPRAQPQQYVLPRGGHHRGEAERLHQLGQDLRGSSLWRKPPPVRGELRGPNVSDPRERGARAPAGRDRASVAFNGLDEGQAQVRTGHHRAEAAGGREMWRSHQSIQGIVRSAPDPGSVNALSRGRLRQNYVAVFEAYRCWNLLVRQGDLEAIRQAIEKTGSSVLTTARCSSSRPCSGSLASSRQPDGLCRP